MKRNGRGWGKPYRTRKELQSQRWVCGRVQACVQSARDGSRRARREKRVLDRGGPGVLYIERWEQMDREMDREKVRV